jgi:hypothetical protein
MLLGCKQSSDTGNKDTVVDNDTEMREHQMKWFKLIGINENFHIPLFHEATTQCDQTDIGGPDGKTIFILLLHFKVR